MLNKKLLAMLPAWLLVIGILAMGSGWAWWGGCCGSPEIDIDQTNAGNGNYRQNYAEATIDNSGYNWGWGGGGEIDVDQVNAGNGNYRDNVAYATVDAGGYGGWGWGWHGGCCGDNSIDIDQGNYGNGNHRDNAAFATWSW